jgi:hypothetical protein
MVFWCVMFSVPFLKRSSATDATNVWHQLYEFDRSLLVVKNICAATVQKHFLLKKKWTRTVRS